jgi:hypothetical protein
MKEVEAGRLVTLAIRIVRGYSTMEISRRFRSLMNGHVYDELAENDRKTVDAAAKIIKEIYGEHAYGVNVETQGRRAS